MGDEQRRRSDDRLKTSELNRLALLAAAVTALREDLIAYRMVLERQLRRGTGAVVALTAVGILLAVLGVQSMANLRATDALVEELRKSEREHRVRNEELHACLVDLVYAVVTTPREERETIPNPCPEPLPAAELEQG